MWQERYNTSDYVFGKAPARFLTDHAGYLVPGATALAVADGEGRNSVFMAEQGMRVTALDFAPAALAKARRLADERGVTVDFRQCDIMREDWPGDFDLVAGIFIQFVGPDGRREQFRKIKAATKPGGLVMLHGYTPKQIEYGTGGPPNPENMYTEEILRAAFVGWEVLVCRAHEREISEGRGHAGMSALIDFIARKPA